MADTFKIPSFDDINLKKIEPLAVDAAASQNQITLVDSATYVVNDRILICSNIGSETSEIMTIQSITGAVITLTSNLGQVHRKGEKVIKLYGDQLKLYRAPNVDGTIPPDSNFTYLTIIANIQPDDMFTELVDPSGGNGYWYKATYYHSLLFQETLLSFSQAIRGGGYGHYCSIEDIRKESGMSSDLQIDDTQIAARRDQAESEIKGRLRGAGYVLPLQDSKNNAFTPPIIENITRLMAAGYVLAQDYGPSVNVTDKDGQSKIQFADELLMMIEDGTIVLLDPADQIIARSLMLAGYPDASAATAGPDGFTPDPPAFTVNRKF